MWSRRAQEYDQKINSGKLYQLAEVVKDLKEKRGEEKDKKDLELINELLSL